MANPQADAYSAPAGSMLRAGRPSLIPSWRVGRSAGTWFALPASSQSGEPEGRIAFCGAALQDGAGQCVMWVGPNGGHDDSSDNSVKSCDILAENPAWVVRHPASAPADRVKDVAYYNDGKPTSRHSYSSQHYSQHHQRLMMFGAHAVYGTGGVNFPKLDAFNPATNAWDAPGTFPDASGRYSCMDPDGNVWYFGAPGGNVGYTFGGWNKSTLDASSTYFGTLCGSPLVYDPVRAQVFSLAWGSGEDKYGTAVTAFVHRNLAGTPTRTPITLTTIGGALALFQSYRVEYGAMEYEPKMDAFLFYDGRPLDGIDRRGVVFIVRPNATTTWTIETMTTTGVPPYTKGAGVCNRFRYSPTLKGMVLYADGLQPLWFLATESM